MEEMEQERRNRENEEKERAERLKKIKDDFNDPNSQWEKDKTELHDIAQKEEASKSKDEKLADDTQSHSAQPQGDTAQDKAAKA